MDQLFGTMTSQQITIPCSTVKSLCCTRSPNLNVSPLVLQLSLPNQLKPGVTSWMKVYLEQDRQAMLQLPFVWSTILLAYQGATYIRGLTLSQNDASERLPLTCITNTNMIVFFIFINTFGSSRSSILTLLSDLQLPCLVRHWRSLYKAGDKTW